MGYPIDLNNTTEPLIFLMVDSTDHITGKTGASPTVTISKNGGVFASPAGAITEVGNGFYQVAANATDANTLGPLALHATAAGCDPTDEVYDIGTYSTLPQVVSPIEPSSDLAVLITKVRYAVGDEGIYRTHIIPVGMINGANKRFQAAIFPLGTETALFDGATGAEITSGFTLVADTGLLVYTLAPSIGSQHFIEGYVYRFPTGAVEKALERAGLHLYGVWGSGTYVVAGTGDSLTFTPIPTGLDLQILVVTAALFLIGAFRLTSAAGAIRISDSSGMQDITARAELLGNAVGDLWTELNNLITDAGYTMPRFPSIDYPDDYQGQVWTEANVADPL
jgi:hypothetical protein